MAENSKREQIIQYWVNKFKAGETSATGRFKVIKRMRLGLEEIEDYSIEQLPLLSIVAKLPRPVAHNTSRIAGGGDVFLSVLSIDFIVYTSDNQTPDSLISDMADDLWTTLYSDPTSGSKPDELTTKLVISPEPVVGHWPPFVIFKMVADFSYYHTTGGI